MNGYENAGEKEAADSVAENKFAGAVSQAGPATGRGIKIDMALAGKGYGNAE